MDELKAIAMTENAVRRLHMQCCYQTVKKWHEDVHPGQITLLCSIQDRPGCTQSELAREHGISCASIGMSVKRLEKAGFLIKRGDENDLRATHLELTEKGAACAQTARKQLQLLAAARLRGFSEEELRQYEGFLRRIRQNLQDYLEEDNA